MDLFETRYFSHSNSRARPMQISSVFKKGMLCFVFSYHSTSVGQGTVTAHKNVACNCLTENFNSKNVSYYFLSFLSMQKATTQEPDIKPNAICTTLLACQAKKSSKTHAVIVRKHMFFLHQTYVDKIFAYFRKKTTSFTISCQPLKKGFRKTAEMFLKRFH